MTTRLGYYAKKFNYVAQTMEKGDVQKWITVGHGDDAKHLPIVDGHIGRGMEGIPHDIAQKIHDGTRHPEKKAKWAEHLAKVKGGEASAAEVEPEPEPRKHTYGLRSRPASYGSVPSGYESEDIHPDFNFGTITYPHELSADEVRSYQLTKIADHEDIGTIADIATKHLTKERLDESLADNREWTLQKLQRYAQDAGLHADPDRILAAVNRKFAGQDPREPAPKTKRASDVKLKEPLPEHLMSYDQFHAVSSPLRSAHWDAERAVKEAKEALIETTPKARRKDSDEMKLEAALKAKKNKPLVEAYEQAQAKERAAYEAYRPYHSGHKMWRIENVLRGYDVPEPDIANNPSMAVAKKVARERILLREKLKDASSEFLDSPNNASMTKLFGAMEKELAPTMEYNQHAAKVDVAKRLLKHIQDNYAPLQTKAYDEGLESLTPKERDIVKWLGGQSYRSPEELLKQWAGRDNRSEGYENTEYINTPLSEPYDKRDAWISSSVTREGRQIADEVRRGRKDQPMPETVWRMKRGDVPEILPHGHGVIEGDGSFTTALQMPDGSHYEGGYVHYSPDQHPDQSEHEALRSAIQGAQYASSTYSHSLTGGLDNETVAAIHASLEPWKQREVQRFAQKESDERYARKERAREIADNNTAWNLSPKEYQSRVGANVSRAVKNAPGGRIDKESYEQAAQREHKHLVELAYYAGHAVPAKALVPGATYYQPHDDVLKYGLERSFMVEPGVGVTRNESLTARAKGMADAISVQKEAFHDALDRHIESKMAGAKWKAHSMEVPFEDGGTETVSGHVSPSGNWLVHQVKAGHQNKPGGWAVSHTKHGLRAGVQATREDARKHALMLDIADEIPGAKKLHSMDTAKLTDRTGTLTKTPGEAKALNIISRIGTIERSMDPADISDDHGVRTHLLNIAKQNGYSEEMPMQKGQPERHEEITLTPEDEEALDRAWDRIAQEEPMRKGKWAERLQPVIEGSKT